MLFDTRPVSGRPVGTGSVARRTLALVAVTAAAAAAIAVGDAATNASASTTETPRTSIAVAATSSTGTQPPPGQAPSTTSQQGFVVEGGGSRDGYSAHVSLYANSLHGDVLEVAIETPDGRTVTPRIGSRTGSLFENGSIAAKTDAITRDDEGQATPAGEILVRGSYSESGKPTRPNGAVRDDGEVVVVRGTNTPLSAQVTVTYGDVVIPVQVTDAFAFDLTVLAQEIGG